MWKTVLSLFKNCSLFSFVCPCCVNKARLNRKTRKLTASFLGMEVSSLRHGGMSLPFSLAVILETFEICSSLYGKPTQTAPVSSSPAWNHSWQRNGRHHSFYMIAIREPRTLPVPGQAGEHKRWERLTPSLKANNSSGDSLLLRKTWSCSTWLASFEVSQLIAKSLVFLPTQNG